MEEKRMIVIDYLRAAAIIAVVMDHSYCLIYTSEKIWSLTFFSVTLFIFLAGITAYLSMKRRNLAGYDWKYTGYRLKKVLSPYMLATAFCIFVNGGWKFSFADWVYAVLHFNGAGPYYFVFFFIQLVLIAPVFYLIITKKIQGGGYRLFKSIIFMAVVTITAIWCTEHTVMIELYGGANYLGGGSYLVIFALGMLYAPHMNAMDKKRAWILSGVSFGVLTVYIWLVFMDQGIFTKIDAIYPAWSANPPGLRLMVYAISIFGLVYGAYNLIGEKPVLRKLLMPFELCGRYSMDIFLYHFHLIIILRNTLFIWMPVTNDSVWLRRICVCFTGIALPVLFRLVYEKNLLNIVE